MSGVRREKRGAEEVTENPLRTRIAAALYDHWWHGTITLKEPPVWEKLSESARESWLYQADAVIRELDSQGLLIDSEAGNRLSARVTADNGGQTRQYGPSPKITTRKAEDE